MKPNNEKIVLLVMSDDWSPDLIGAVFEIEGYTVFYSKDGEGLKMLQEIPLPDVIVIGGLISTPKGPWLICELRKNYPEFAKIPFLLLSAMTRISPADIGCPTLLGDRALTTPVDAEDLLETVGKILANND